MSITKKQDLPYNSNLKQRAAELRKAGNLSEVLFWNQVKNGKFNGLDFDRQIIIGNFIVDFYCAEKKTVIEIDGGIHNERAEYDAERDAFLTGLGLRVVRIRDKNVKGNIDGIMQYLKEII